MKKFVLLAAMLAVAFTAMPASASVQNVKVYGNLDNTYVYRSNLDLGKNSDGNGKPYQSIFLTQTRLGVDADLTDNVAVTVGLINERAWGSEKVATVDSANDTDVDVYLAFVTLREMLYSPLTVIIGRQQWGYGNGLIFDATGTNNSAPVDSGLDSVAEDLTYQTSMDAFRIILDYNPLTIEAFYALIDNGAGLTQTSEQFQDNRDVVGVYATYALGDDMDSAVETYFFKSTDRNASGDNDNVIKVYGFRASSNPFEGLSVSGEFAIQGGQTSAGKRRESYAWQFVSNYSIPLMEEYNPILSYSFTKVGGDDNASDGDTSAWDPFFEAQGGGTIYNTLFNLTDMIIHTVSLETVPMEDLTATLSWSGLWTQQDTTDRSSLTLNNPDGTTYAVQTTDIKDNESELGQEVDLGLSYAYTEDVTIGANFGWFFPGAIFLDEYEEVAKQAIVTLGVNF
jgi:hypothetical protein